MTISELISRLSKLDPNLPVYGHGVDMCGMDAEAEITEVEVISADSALPVRVTLN